MRGAASLSLYGFALVVAFALFTVHGLLGTGLALLWAFVVFPAGALLVRRRLARRGHGGDPVVSYWRTGNWQSGRH